MVRRLVGLLRRWGGSVRIFLRDGVPAAGEIPLVRSAILLGLVILPVCPVRCFLGEVVLVHAG